MLGIDHILEWLRCNGDGFLSRMVLVTLTLEDMTDQYFLPSPAPLRREPMDRSVGVYSELHAATPMRCSMRSSIQLSS
ncbi:MAG: hypothetical protein V1267_08310 [Alphaproteobacteria bacterium]|jgi:hypothetical protein|nr:hypothetical protein [Alphaproteobacteria bacterium]|tara:strand:- start:792 stop:1025 length:234 start_codon:yes stop_codon:yes gene_type:complete